MKKTIFLLAVALLLAASIIAQDPVRQPGKPPLSAPANPINISFSGNEVAPAAFDSQANMFHGNSFALVSEDRENINTLSISYDYVQDEQDATIYHVVSGSWMLTVYDNGVYTGTLYGDLASGDMTELIDGETGQVIRHDIKAAFHITGGLDGYADTQPAEGVSGTYIAYTDYNEEGKTLANLTYNR
jgi:hypothetical protein